MSTSRVTAGWVTAVAFVVVLAVALVVAQLSAHTLSSTSRASAPQGATSVAAR